MSRREQIKMTQAEIAEFLAEERTANVATIGRNTRPHVVPLWFVPEGGGLVSWTYESSQKVANLRRLAQASVLVEAGESYEELRGVLMECDVEVVTDADEVVRIGGAVTERYAGNPEIAVAAYQFIRVQAAKRVGLRFTPTHVTSWDHRKLGGTY
ncbi:pyridoxamine 5'-phosphate oxidase family protein [Actinokineospora globicatena]|uniref:pyridoxamine 5'-phosphate oxidase family protein n=1 Tax=Actinokineospora globicatena TaxID=103729 RepID=UPI0020A53AD0|nr:pyridoxamine 5'-phosphate oxidase family protein [Actinokineospora globicatena]MCP2301416.1 PPOX class probable F420-dependent enzyme [Actinokineospora globicatena]